MTSRTWSGGRPRAPSCCNATWSKSADRLRLRLRGPDLRAPRHRVPRPGRRTRPRRLHPRRLPRLTPAAHDPCTSSARRLHWLASGAADACSAHSLSREVRNPLTACQKWVECPPTPRLFALAPRSGERVRERGNRQRASGGPLSPPSPRCAGRGANIARRRKPEGLFEHPLGLWLRLACRRRRCLVGAQPRRGRCGTPLTRAMMAGPLAPRLCCPRPAQRGAGLAERPGRTARDGPSPCPLGRAAGGGRGGGDCGGAWRALTRTPRGVGAGGRSRRNAIRIGAGAARRAAAPL